MAEIISFHSFRGGTGKSHTTANVAALLALAGRRVGVVDTDIQSPGIHVLFGLDQTRMRYSLNDYLWGRCSIKQVAYDVTANLSPDMSGQLFLIPSSIDAGDIARVLREGYEVSRLNDGFHNLVDDLNLDVLLVDTHPGLNEETLLSIAMSNAMVIVLRPDHQDYEGTNVTVQIARRLKVPRMFLVVNKTPPVFDFDEVKDHVEKTYGCEVAAVLPHSDELMVLSSLGIFALRYPDHPMTALFKQIVAKLMAS